MARYGVIRWSVELKTLNPFLHLPRATHAASEVQTSPKYHHEGWQRSREDHCIFKYTLAGEGAFRDARGEHRTPAGTGFLSRIDDTQTAYYYPEDGRGPWTFAYLTFRGQSARAAVEEMTARYGAIYRLPRTGPSMRRILGFGTLAGGAIELAPEEGAGLVLNLLLELAGTKERERRDDPGNVLVRLAQDLVQENVEQNLNVSALARRLRVSREHLTRVFRATLHQTPHEYITRRRMLLACQLLKETTLTVKELAAQLGYSTPSHFSRCFRAEIGNTPADFRDRGIMPVG